jgi:hypothetical protein
LQDVNNPKLIVGADVESLYPSLEAQTVANIVYKAMLETEIKFKNIDFKEAIRYIALNWTEKECRTSNIWKLLPWRSKKQGVRPGMTGEGPLGPDQGKKDQWKFPNLGRFTGTCEDREGGERKVKRMR